MRALSMLLVGAVALAAVSAIGVSPRDAAEPGSSTSGASGRLGAPNLVEGDGPPGPALPRLRFEPPDRQVPGSDRDVLGSPGADGQPGDGDDRWTAPLPIDPGPAEGVGPVIVSPEGFQVVPGTAAAGSGPRVTYTVEVMPSIGVDPLAVAAAVEAALNDPRSWVNEATLVRVDDLEEADIRVVLAEPAMVDRLCAEAGLDTGGRYSCWNGRVAALNAMRWEQGAADFEDLTTYRRYLINHEFGHGLGYGHEECTRAGELAPVMMQQTKGTGGCEVNGWAYPDLPPD